VSTGGKDTLVARKVITSGARVRALGLEAVYGAALDGVGVVQVPIDLAPLFADAHARVRGRRAGVHRGDGVVVDAHGAAVVPPGPAEGWVPPGDDVVDALASAASPAVVAGPGVVRRDAVPGLHALAAAGSVGVLNTWGAKGVFDWRSRHHLATVGLQALDFLRGGLADADLIVVSGAVDQEMLADWRLAPVVEVAPESLGPLAELWGRSRTEIMVPPLRTDLSRVTQTGWEVAEARLPPSRVTRHYSLALGGGGLVAADPGAAGYWVARTFGTSGIGGAQVPSDRHALGFAVACAIVARLLEPTRTVLAVIDAVDEVHERLLELAGRLGVSVALEVWSDDGEALDATAHATRLDQLLVTGGRATIATDPSQLHEMIAVAGPIVAWTRD